MNTSPRRNHRRFFIGSVLVLALGSLLAWFIVDAKKKRSERKKILVTAITGDIATLKMIDKNYTSEARKSIKINVIMLRDKAEYFDLSDEEILEVNYLIEQHLDK